MKGKEERINIKTIIKDNMKIVIGIVIGIILISGTTAYGATILFQSEQVSYDNTTSGMRASNVQSALDELYVESTSYQLFEQRVSAIENKLYPVGSYIETSDASFNPNTSLVGTWVKETEGMVHVSGGTTYTVSKASNNSGAGEKDGGNKDAIVPYHRHSVAKVTSAITGGAHTHTWSSAATAGPGSSRYAAAGNTINVGGTGEHTHDLPAHNTDYAGTEGNATNANMQPYINVYRWHRTA